MTEADNLLFGPQREFLTSQLSAATLALATLSSALADAHARLRRTQQYLQPRLQPQPKPTSSTPLHQQLRATQLEARAAVAEADRLEGVLARWQAGNDDLHPALRQLMREHRGMRAQRKLVPANGVCEQECVYLRVEVEMARAVVGVMRKEMDAVPRINDQ